MPNYSQCSIRACRRIPVGSHILASDEVIRMDFGLKLRRTFLSVLISLCCSSPLLATPVIILVPEESLFPAPIADQNFPRFALSFPLYLHQEIDTLQDDCPLSLREVLEFGGVQSLFRIEPKEGHPLAFELSIGAGVITLFDSFEDKLDNFGWEGSGFLTLNFKVTQQVRFRFGFHHLSSHVGDEYIANYGVIELPVTDQQDLVQGDTYGLNYVRDSLMGGISFYISPKVRIYLEARYSMDMLRYMLCYNSFPWQANIGLELNWPLFEWPTQSWYLAIHTSSYQETSWFPSTTIQAGQVVNVPGSNQRFRFGLEYYRGRVQIASFNHNDSLTPTSWENLQIEQYFAIGAWYDF